MIDFRIFLYNVSVKRAFFGNNVYIAVHYVQLLKQYDL